MTDTKRTITASVLIVACIAIIIFFTGGDSDTSNEYNLGQENTGNQLQANDDRMPMEGQPPLEADANFENERRRPDLQIQENIINQDSPENILEIDNIDIQEYEICLNGTGNLGDCKDCCDCLDAESEVKKSCRDACPINDFSVNTNIIEFDIPSDLGQDGDYSVCTVLSTEQECKECCDSSSEFVCGDYQYCRTACTRQLGL